MTRPNPLNPKSDCSMAAAFNTAPLGARDTFAVDDSFRASWGTAGLTVWINGEAYLLYPETAERLVGWLQQHIVEALYTGDKP